MARLGVTGTVRASFAIYNDADDVERLAAAVRSIAAGPKVARTESEPDEADYPGPSGPSVDAAAAELLDEFDGLGDWAERYEFLIELGRKAPALPDAFRTEANRVRGCQSTVFLAPRVRPGTRDTIEFLADSDSELVAGLLAVLQELFSGRPAAEVLAFDLQGFLEQAGLQSNLTTGRRNGLAEMIKRLNAFATEASGSR
jgi:cysteine desulfurase/selenocysteine lyase